MNGFKLKLLVKKSSEYPDCSEVRYILEGKEGLKILGKKISSKNIKLSSLINIIHLDSLSILP